MKRCFSLLFLLLLDSSFFFAQNVDSLKLALKNANHDTSKCFILSSLANIAPDGEWEKYNEQLKNLTESKLKILTPSNPLYKTFKNYYANSLNNIALIFQDQGDFIKALESFVRSLKIKEAINDKKGIATTLNNIGLNYQYQGDIPKALEFYYKSLKSHEERDDKKAIAFLLNNIGSVYQNQGNIPKALEYYSKSLKIRELFGEKSGIATSLINIGAIHLKQGDVTKALEYFCKSLKNYDEIGEKSGVARSLNNIGYAYSIQGDVAKALEHYGRCLKIQEEMGNKRGIAGSTINIGNIYYSEGDFPKALENYERSLKIQEEIGDKNGMATALNNAGNIYYKQKRYNKAKDFAIRSMKLSIELGYPEKINGAAKLLNLVYKTTGNYKLALENYELHIQMRDSVKNDENKKASIKNQLKYEYEKKAAADSVKNAEEQKVKDAQLVAQNASLKSEKTQRYALYGGLVLVVGFLVFVFNRFRVTNKQKKIIEEQKIVVDEAFEKLAEKNKEVIDSITYARRIQRALITSETYINRKLKDIR